MAVRKTKYGYYSFSVYITDNFGNRKRIQKQSPEWTSRSKATAAEAEFLRSASAKNPIEFSELATQYIDYKKMTVKHSSWYDIQAVYDRHIAPTFAKMKMSKITPAHIITWQKSLLDASYRGNFYSNAQLSKIQKYLKAMFSWAYQHDMIEKDPTKAMRTVKREEIKKDEQVLISPDEFKQFIEVVDHPVYKTLYNVLYYCGLRLGEAMALTFRDVDIKNTSVKITKTYNFKFREITSPKTKNSTRIVEMPDIVVSHIRELYKHYEGKYEYDLDCPVFGVMSYRTMTRRLDEWIELSEVKRFGHHDLRHSCVSLLANAGFNDFQAAKRMGHDVRMFNEVYGHLFPNSQKEMARALDKVAQNSIK